MPDLDIVARLRDLGMEFVGKQRDGFTYIAPLLRQAADEIEELREEIKQRQETEDSLTKWVDHYGTALERIANAWEKPYCEWCDLDIKTAHLDGCPVRIAREALD